MKIPLTIGLPIVKGKFIMTKFHHAVIICLILFAIFSVYLLIPSESGFLEGADEGYYFKYAANIIERGIAGFPELIKSYVKDPRFYLMPPPSRTGHILSAALWLRLFGVNFITLFKFSFFCYVLFILVNIYYSRKIFGRDISYLFTLLVSSSPLIMAMGRRAFLDSNVNLWWAVSVWAFLDFLISKNKIKFFVFLLSYSFCITVKESSLLLLVFFIISFFIHRYYFKNIISIRYLFGIIFIPLAIAGVFYTTLFGGVVNFIGLMKVILDVHFGSVNLSHYAVLFCSGPWYRYIIDFLLLSPINTLLFIGYTGYILICRKWEWNKLYFLLYFVVIFAILSSLKHTKVVRFVINLDMVIVLFSVFMLYDLFREEINQNKTQSIFILTIIIFFINYQHFFYLFCQQNISDPISYWLLVANKFIPELY